MGEVENISPGLSRKLIVQLTEPGTYQTACKPGMVGDGIRGDFTVTGEAVKIDTEGKFKEAADSYKRYVNSQTDALIPATQVFVDAVKKGDVAAAKAQFPIARTYYERIEPVAESFPDDLDPASTCARPTSNPARSGPASTPSRSSWVTGLQPDANALADQLLADVKELDAGVKAPSGPSTPPRSPVAHRDCSTRSPPQDHR
jgi:iron uptake system component EfeO